MKRVKQILNAIVKGDDGACRELLPLVYDELRRLAGKYLAQEAPGQTLQPTALVHEAYLRLVGTKEDERWNGRSHFIATAAEVMRHILVDNARRKRRVKRGGGRKRVDLTDAAIVLPDRSEDLLALDDALTRLSVEDPPAAALVQLRYFGGLSVEQAGEHLGMSRATAYRQWTFARAWLLENLNDGESAKRGDPL